MREDTAEKIMAEVRSGYDTIADEFAASQRGLYWPELDDFRARIRSGSRVLDVGCGSGRAYGLFVGTAVDYEGIDVSEKLIAIARRQYPDVLAYFRVGSMLELPYESGSFDAVLMVAALHHLPGPARRLRALREVARVLKPGGRLMMTNWDLWQPRRLKWLFRGLLLKLVGRSGLDWTDVMVPWGRGPAPVWRYYHGFTLGELDRLCRSVGLVIERNRRERRRPGGDVNLVTVAVRPPGADAPS